MCFWRPTSSTIRAKNTTSRWPCGKVGLAAPYLGFSTYARRHRHSNHPLSDITCGKSRLSILHPHAHRSDTRATRVAPQYAVHHRVHHGINNAYLDRNFGGILIIWDKLFGTFTLETEPVEFGLVKPFRIDGAAPANITPWYDLVHAARAFSGTDRLRVWVKNPGWMPGDRSAADARSRIRPAKPPHY